MTPIDDWIDAKRVLCVRLDALGDVLMTTPALTALQQYGDRRLTLLASSAGSAIAPLLPMIDETIVYDAPWMKATTLRDSGRFDREMIGCVRAKQFDAAVIFTVYSQNPLPAALFCHLADIPLRLAHARENPYQLLTHWIKEPEPQQFVRHEVRRQLDLVSAIGAGNDDDRLRVRVRPRAMTAALQLLCEAGLDTERRWLVLHPGASAPSRRYPPEHFAAAARILHVEHGFQLVFSGTADERALVESIIESTGVSAISLAGQTTLEEFAAVLVHSPLLVTNNTGPVHLAAAVGTPVVDLYSLTNMQHTPWHVPHELLFHDVPCKNCYKSVCPEGHHNCLRLVTPDAVIAAALRLLAGSKPTPGEYLQRSIAHPPGPGLIPAP